MYSCTSHYQGGWTPLHSASVYGHKDVTGALLSNGADVNAKTNVSVVCQGWLLWICVVS